MVWLGLGFDLFFVYGKLVVMYTYFYGLPLSLSLSRLWLEALDFTKPVSSQSNAALFIRLILRWAW